MNQQEPKPEPSNLDEKRRTTTALFVWIAIFIGLLGLTAVVFAPFISTIVIALVLTSIGFPFYSWLLRRIGEKRRGLAAGLTCAALIFVVVLPLSWIGWSAAIQAVDGVKIVASHMETISEQSWFQDLTSVGRRQIFR